MPATFLSSQQSVAQKKAVFKELSQARPSCKLLYVTPEQLVKSQALVEILQRLDRRGLFSSLVIDEVCLQDLQSSASICCSTVSEPHDSSNCCCGSRAG